jgi:hypothetical protein
MWAAVPGITGSRETSEASTYWGPASSLIFTNGYIAPGCIDAGNSPTWEIRPGLVLGQITATGQWTNYSPTATDGSEVAGAVMITSLRMQDLQGVNQPRFFALICGGRVQSAYLNGLDNMARQQMADFFKFDDNLQGRRWVPWMRFQTKVASYQILATDNLNHFDNLGATGAVTFTLPAIANGYSFGFTAMAAQNLLVTSFEGGNIVALNNLVANTVSFQTGAQIIGGSFRIYSNPAGTKWLVENLSAGTNTVTVA